MRASCDGGAEQRSKSCQILATFSSFEIVGVNVRSSWARVVTKSSMARTTWKSGDSTDGKQMSWAQSLFKSHESADTIHASNTLQKSAIRAQHEARP